MKDYKVLQWVKVLGKKPKNKNKPCLIYPENKYKKIWDLYVTVLLIYTAIAVPYTVCFNINREDSFNIGFDLTIDFSFLVDIILTFFTVIEQGDQVVTNRCQIAKSYLKGWFLIDTFTTIPF